MEKCELSRTVEIETSLKTNGRRVATGIEGLDGFMNGGFPRGSVILLAGTAGSGKTIFASQYLYDGISRFNESGVYMSMAENRNTFIRNMKKIGMDFRKCEQEGKFKFLDTITVRDKGVGSIVEHVLEEVDSLKAKRLVIDSFSALVQAFADRIDARIMLHTVLGKIAHVTGVTTLLIAEKPIGTEGLGGGMEEFVSDGVITLDSVTRKGWLTRRLQVVKMRGTKINSEEHSYDIDEHGIRTYPLPELRPVKKIRPEKTPSGIDSLDKMLFGGFFKGSTTLVGGSSGTGKTTFALHFIIEGAKRNVRGLYVSLEEPQAQLVRNAEGFGWRASEFVDKGSIKFVSFSPEPFNVEQQLGTIYNALEEYRPARFVIDGIGTMERVMIEDRYLRYLKSLTLYLKDKGITTLITALGKSVLSVTGTGVSSSVDNIIVLRNVEIESTFRRSIAILKSRGTSHDNEIKEFEITPKGVVLKKKFVGMKQVLGGTSRRSRTEGARRP